MMIHDGLLLMAGAIGALVGYATAALMFFDGVQRRDWHGAALGVLQFCVALTATAMLPQLLDAS